MHYHVSAVFQKHAHVGMTKTRDFVIACTNSIALTVQYHRKQFLVCRKQYDAIPHGLLRTQGLAVTGAGK